MNQLQEKEPYKLSLSFIQGEPVAINNQNYKNTVDAIKFLNELGGKYAIGRGMHVGDTVIGSKGRVGFEAPAAILIIEAHRMLEKHVLSKWQMYWKDQLANWYGMLLHESQYFEPVMRNIEKFLEDSQKRVTGEVLLTLYPYRFEIEGIKSEYDLANAKFGSYGEENTLWTGEDVKGFTKILANSMFMHHSLD
ncbi:MAG: argininosuccinate synthase [Bacteroidales bacterium]|nr:argininosuccinate synthase [Bacteroidales bacterium]